MDKITHIREKDDLNDEDEINEGVYMKELNGNKLFPVRSTHGSAAYDLTCTNQKKIILSKESILVGTGITLQLPCNMHALILPRSSSLYKKNINVEIGLIDSDYHGEINVQVSSNEFGTPLKTGDVVAQLLLQKTYYFDNDLTNLKTKKDFEHKGFGSTSK